MLHTINFVLNMNTQELKNKIAELHLQMKKLPYSNYVKRAELTTKINGLKKAVEEIEMYKADNDFFSKKSNALDFIHDIWTVCVLLDIANGYIMGCRKKYKEQIRHKSKIFDLLDNFDEQVKRNQKFVTDIADSDGMFYSEAYSDFCDGIENSPEILALRNKISKAVAESIKENNP